MKKKLFAMAATVATMTLGMSFNSFAASEPLWIVPKTQENIAVWHELEAEAQAKKWAEDHKGDIANIADENARYDAVVQTVCDFLTYDSNYLYPHLAYTIRDGKGVCSDYTALTKALCDIVGIKCEVGTGKIISQAADHDWNIVTLNGVQYYSDVTNVDAGSTQYKLSTSMWADYDVYDVVYTTLYDAARQTGTWTGDSAERTINYIQNGVVTVYDAEGNAVMLNESDVRAFESDAISIEELLNRRLN